MYDELFALVAADVEAGGVFASLLAGHEDDPAREAVPLRLLGGLHRLVLDGRAPALRRWYPSTGGTWDAKSAWPDIVRVAGDHADALRAALARPPQTNEVGRSAALIGGLLRLDHGSGLPVRLFEIGSSAGLNLRADHYRYEYAGGRWGPADSPVSIDDAWRGRLPPEGTVRIVERHGYDIAPIDVTGPEPVEHRGYVPPYSVVVPGTRPKEFPAGTFQIGCALIIGTRSAQTDLKTSLNDVLREFELGS